MRVCCKSVANQRQTWYVADLPSQHKRVLFSDLLQITYALPICTIKKPLYRPPLSTGSSGFKRKELIASVKQKNIGNRNVEHSWGSRITLQFCLFALPDVTSVPVPALDWNSDSVSDSGHCLCHQSSDGTDAEDLMVLAIVKH
ncbi:hypothetical protein Syun_028376 [Stephania yunnanensis]|uniref:Uncharacterized protein n=1 Tax=Stephania yunnanensis TaxID=152371 RepID=A0AAP0HS20_9MAGN